MYGHLKINTKKIKTEKKRYGQREPLGQREKKKNLNTVKKTGLGPKTKRKRCHMAK